jgi:hypothetical protein
MLPRPFFHLLSLCLLPLAAYAATGEGPKIFDLPTGAAEQRLLELSEQAGVQILFPTDIVQDIQTNAIQGSLSPRSALERMLAGTTLIVAPEDGSGTLEVRRAAEPKATLVVLPPLSVTSQGVPWRFAESPGFVFLSHCADSVTRAYMEGMARALRILELLVPPEFMLQSDVPQIIILSPDGGGTSSMSQNLLNNFSDAPAAAPSGVPANMFNIGALDGLDRIVSAQTKLRVVRDMELIDRDRIATFTSVQEATFDGNRVVVRPAHFEHGLETRRPALPSWVVAGVMKLYADPKAAFQVDGLHLPGFTWLSTAETRQAANDARFRAGLLMPMAELFSAPASATRDAQAALLVRWSLDSWVSARESAYTKATRAARGGRESQPNREAFWKFVGRAANEPVSEAMFHECFGIGYAEMNARLADYLRDAVRSNVRLQLGRQPAAPPAAVRDATPAEVARIKGDWERLETGFVKVRHPQYAQSYAFQTRATLMKAYRDGGRDPGLLAVLGLYETNLGDDGAARPHLEAAVAGGVVRPQVYYELARIRYAEAQANPAGRNGMLSAAQAAAVTAPLLAGHQQSPPLRECFDLAAVVWSKSDVALTRRELALLEVGLKAFPHDSDLLYKTALVNAVQGFKAETTKLVERGLKQSRDTDNHARFLDILTKLDPENGMLPVESFRYVERRTPRATFEAIVWAATIGADSTLTGALALEGDAKQQAELLRIELASRTQRAEYATTDKLAALSYKHLFTGVTGVQILDQAKAGDGPVQLEVRLRRKDDTISNEIFAFQMGVGGWQLLVSDGQMQRLRDQLAEARPAGPVGGGKQKTPDVLVVSDVLAPIPAALRPQPGKPVYYQILGQRENDLGSSVANEARLEPEVIKRDVIRTLAAQGFMQTGPRGPKPALSILIEWGSANLDIDEFTVPAMPKPDFGTAPDPAAPPEPPPADTEVITTVYNRREIMMLVGADKANLSALSPQEIEQINDAMRRRRSYVLVGAFETATLAKKQKKLLWRTRMSIDALDQSLPDALGTMLASGAPQFGQNVDHPVFVTERDRQAEVQIGTAVVVPDEAPPAKQP